MKTSTLQLSAPIDRWDEAIPLGNGLMGTLLWGEGNRLKLSLDRGDLWDLRPMPILQRTDFTWTNLRKLVRQKKQAEIVKRFDESYAKTSHPTKIPAGRIELTLDRSVAVRSFDLDLATAVGRASWNRGSAQVFCSATAKVGMIAVQGSGVKARIVPAAFGGKSRSSRKVLCSGELTTLGYPPPRLGRAGNLQWSLQRGVDGFAFAITLGTRRVAGATWIAYAVTCTNDGPDPVAIGRARVRQALEEGFPSLLHPHAQWWKQFWSRSRVRLPDPDLQQHYELTQYFYGAASRRGAPPIPLQGVWTADEGMLPPWKGDYHHDLNTQLTYWAYLTPGHLDEGLSFLDFLWNLLPAARKFARSFYGTPGACLPAVMSLTGQPLGGWPHYSFAPTNMAWLAHSFYLHWRHTLDRNFLRDRAYPWCAEVGRCIEALLEPDKDGRLVLPLSASPEMHDNTLKAWMKPNTTYDLALLRWLFGALAEMAAALGDAPAARHWKGVLGKLGDFAVDKKGSGVLMLSADEGLRETHRHMSHLMPIHPLGLMHIEGSERDRAVIRASLAQIDAFGTGYWCGYSFGWMACLAARAGQPEKARMMLDLYLRGFVSRNGFHLNGDFKNQGLSSFKYRPFTLEGNFAAAQGIHEMLLQTWGGVARIFPAVSAEWNDVEFEDLLGEGALRISARRIGGRTVRVKITAKKGGTIRLRDPFNGAKSRWNRRDVKKRGADYIVKLTPGQTLEGLPA
jgi:alpha-L-fucosidase 2